MSSACVCVCIYICKSDRVCVYIDTVLFNSAFPGCSTHGFNWLMWIRSIFGSKIFKYAKRRF